MSSPRSEAAGPKGTPIRVAEILAGAGILLPSRPDRTMRQLWALHRWGATVAGGYRAAAARSPDRVAVVDERRSVTFRDLHARALLLADGLEALGAAPGSRVAVLCRNHAWFVEAVLAAAEIGADVMLCNTGLSTRATAEVLRAHGPAVIVADAEFAGHVAAARLGSPWVVAWPEDDGAGDEAEEYAGPAGYGYGGTAESSHFGDFQATGFGGVARRLRSTDPAGSGSGADFGPAAAAAHRLSTSGTHGILGTHGVPGADTVPGPHGTGAAGRAADRPLPDHLAAATATVDDLIADAAERAGSARRKPPARPGRLIVLTSGTTGAPKGAYRANPPGLATAAVLVSRIPLKAAETVLVATPLFHMWGLAALQIGMPLRDTLILQRRFEPEAALRAVAEHRCEAVFAVPVVLQRIMELPAALRGSLDTSSLRVVATSGASIPSSLVTDFMDAFGDVLYNFYGSTEVSWAAIADPEDLRTAPSTAGRPPLDSRLKVLEPHGGEVVDRGVTGRIFVENEMLFEGYTSGDTKEFRGGYMATGDVGHLDSSGRLFVHGREADMIVCGGEGLFPREVEDLLATAPEIREAAVVGVPDADSGQRFAAYVVVRPGAVLTAAQVRMYVARSLPPSRVPRDVVFVDALPRNATGKVMVRNLPPSLAGD